MAALGTKPVHALAVKYDAVTHDLFGMGAVVTRPTEAMEFSTVHPRQAFHA
jgi:hypothetical protein